MILPARYKPSGKALAGGGMSDTVLCDDLHLQRPVVVKTLKKGTDPRRILDELSALQNIRSKHVVQIYDVIRDTEGFVVAIVEEYIPGLDLTAAPTPQTTDEFCKIAYPIAEGIADIHTHGRVHRDIKRQNMKFDAEGCLKIFDFGLARALGVDASTVGEVGTPGYMAPELFESTIGGTVNFTSAVDTYAFGATILALVRGSIPKQMREMPPRLPCFAADFLAFPKLIPQEVGTALNSCLEKDISARPSMSMLARLIGQHLLRDRHRALLVSAGSTYVLDAKKRVVQLSVTGRGTLDISYDGLRFVVTALSGDVAINNMAVSIGDTLPGSCVITLGAVELGTRRTFITVDVAHPEVAL
jgi:eukaryotic-like serine/threonine-protein kinase